MPEQSKFNPRQVIIIAMMLVGFLGFAVVPLISLFNSSNNSSPAPTNLQSSKEELIKKFTEQEKSYQKILEREPKNTFALERVTDARLKLYQITGDVTMLQKSLPTLDELIKQNPKNQTLAALKHQIAIMIERESKKPAH